MFHFIFGYNCSNLIDFDNFSTFRNRNKYSTKHVQTVSLQPDYISTLRRKTNVAQNTADPLLHYVLLNRLF